MHQTQRTLRQHQIQKFHTTMGHQAADLHQFRTWFDIQMLHAHAYHFPVLLSALSEGTVSKEGLHQLANQAVSDELVHLLANSDIQTGQLCYATVFNMMYYSPFTAFKCHNQANRPCCMCVCEQRIFVSPYSCFPLQDTLLLCRCTSSDKRATCCCY